MLKALGRIPQAGDEAVVPLPPPDPEAEGQRVATLTVEHMDGLRIDRLALRVREEVASDE
ncbi:transporter associated domain-containing protein [Nocardioides sp. TF02-7]|uniref:transporter associated domain-containing protein n=1 Tax=Nocardioides sp. TF02-7 TaxID=2917724 RepID=UPI001F06ACEE|nr:transporter associated domain-containing protein [Nocardioides sp. TF02-7]UMG92552.1 hypothetical protein MF408_22530 [Nocardioides sp. TF02-7]